MGGEQRGTRNEGNDRQNEVAQRGQRNHTRGRADSGQTLGRNRIAGLDESATWDFDRSADIRKGSRDGWSVTLNGDITHGPDYFGANSATRTEGGSQRE